MSAALAELPEAVTTTTTRTSSTSSTARAEASRANGRISRGPTSPQGRLRSRQNGCKEGFTGAGVVLPPGAEEEVARREAEFASDFRPRNTAERELVRQMALAAWRSNELSIRIIEHDTQMNAARFTNWEQSEQLTAVALGRRLSDDPEAIAIELQRGSAGCAWMIGRWDLLLGGLFAADEERPDCTWSDDELALALDLLGRPGELRHLDAWAARLETLRDLAHSGSDEAVKDLRGIIDEEIARLEARGKELWDEVEEPRLRAWRAGREIDLGIEGTRLRRYEAAADRLFRSAWTRLERLRQERGEPLMPRSASPAEPAPAPAVAPHQVQSVPAVPDSPPSTDSAAALDFWAACPPFPEIKPVPPSRNKTNPAPGGPAVKAVSRHDCFARSAGGIAEDMAP